MQQKLDQWGIPRPDNEADAGSWLDRLIQVDHTIDRIVERLFAGGVYQTAVLGVVLVVAVGLVWRTSAAHSPRQDPDRPLIRSRRARRMVRKTLSPRRVRVPYLIPWPFFGRLLYGVHALVIATTGSGKSAALLMWALAYHIRHWSSGRRIRHLVLYDPKGEFFETFTPLYNALGWRYYIYSMLPEHPASATLNIVATPKMARTAAQALYPEEGHWHQKSRQLFLASASATKYRSLTAIYELLQDVAVLESACQHDTGLRRAYTSIAEKERSSILSTAIGPLSLLDDPNVSRVFSPDADTEQPDYSSRETPCAAHICVDWEDGRELAPLTSALQEVIFSLAQTAGKKAAGKRRRGPGTYSYLDEATSGGLRAAKVMSYLAAGRGSRVYTAVVAQDVPQVEGQLGTKPARSAMSNAQIKLIGQTDDPDTQEYAQKVSGMTRIKWEPPRAMPSVLRGGKAEPRRIESIRRPRLLADYFADMGWGTFFARSRTPLRTREIVEMPSFEDYQDRLIPDDSSGWAMHGVSRTAIADLIRRIIAGDPELQDSEWIPEWLRRKAAEVERRVLENRANRDAAGPDFGPDPRRSYPKEDESQDGEDQRQSESQDDII